MTPAEVAAWLREGLRLIVVEAEQFPDEDGIGAGRMAANILKAADRLEEAA